MIRPFTLAGLAALACAGAPGALAADFSGSLGWNSEYIFRGIPQKSSSAFAGLEVEAGGFHAGAWAADVGDGLEIDYYGGYGFEAGELSLAAGFTWYTYTGDFDDEYLELNLGAEWRWLSFDVAIGQYDNFAGPTLDYHFYTLTATHKGFYGVVGRFEEDFDGEYYEAGYGDALSVQATYLFDYAVALIHGTDTLLGGKSDTNLVLTLSRSFDF